MSLRVRTLPAEARTDIVRLALSPDGSTLIAVDAVYSLIDFLSA